MREALKQVAEVPVLLELVQFPIETCWTPTGIGWMDVLNCPAGEWLPNVLRPVLNLECISEPLRMVCE